MRQQSLLSIRINRSTRKRQAWIEVADVPVNVEVSWLQFVTKTIAQRKILINLPLVLRKEVVVGRLTVVVLRYDIVEGLIRQATQKVCEIYPREKAFTARRVVLEGPIVIRTIEAERRNRLDGADVQASLHLVVALGPVESVRVHEGIGLRHGTKTIGIQGTYIVEVKLRNAVIEKVLQAGQAKSLRE